MISLFQKHPIFPLKTNGYKAKITIFALRCQLDIHDIGMRSIADTVRQSCLTLKVFA